VKFVGGGGREEYFVYAVPFVESPLVKELERCRSGVYDELTEEGRMWL